MADGQDHKSVRRKRTQGGPEIRRVEDSVKTFTSAGGGLYRNTATASWYERPWINGKRTWRKLEARTQKEAREVLTARRADQVRSKIGLATNPYASGRTVGEILLIYAKAGFPDRHRQSRSGKARSEEERNTKNLDRLLGSMLASAVSPKTCDMFADMRRAEIRDSGRLGNRTVDKELQSLSMAFSYAVRTGVAQSNPIRHDRPRYDQASKARHSRDCMPASGDELHRLAHALADDPRGEVLAWQCLFSALTGCRTSEILRLRFDAALRKPGFVESDWLWIERAKGGVNPFVVLHPDLRACMDAHRAWHQKKHPGSPWWFPSPRVKGPVEATSLVKALKRVSKVLGLGDRTGHGLRAFYVTVRRAAGISDGQVAAEIGDKTASLISTTYGQIPPGWRGGPQLSWRPIEAAPFWKAFSHIENAGSAPE
jgi:integrase